MAGGCLKHFYKKLKISSFFFQESLDDRNYAARGNRTVTKANIIFLACLRNVCFSKNFAANLIISFLMYLNKFDVDMNPICHN